MIHKYDMQINKQSPTEHDLLRSYQNSDRHSQKKTVEPSQRIGPSPFFWLILLSLTLILRLVEADTRGIWQDEGLTLYQVRLSFGEIFANRIPVAHFITQNTVPPLYFLLLSAWGRALGYGLWALRLFSIFCSLLVSVLIYRVGAWIDHPRTGRIAALLTAISPLYLWYAQELRMYTFLLMPATLSFGLLWRWYQASVVPPHAKTTKAVTTRWALAYGLTAGAMAWTHYLAFLLIGAQLLWLLIFIGGQHFKSQSYLKTADYLAKFPKVLLIMGGGLLLIALPLIPFGLRRLFTGAERDFYFQSLDFIANNMLHSAAFGVPIFMVSYEQIDFLFPLAWLLLALGLWQAWRRGGWALLSLLLGGLVLPILALYTLSYIKPLYQNARHLIFITPPFYLLWALGLLRLAEIRRWLPLLIVPFLAYSWLLATNHYFNPTRSLKNDIRPLFEELAEQYVPGDVVALNDPVLQHAFEYLAPGVPWTVLPPYGNHDPEAKLQAYQATAEQYDRVWYVSDPRDTGFETSQEVYEWFIAHHFRLAYRNYSGQSLIKATLFDTQSDNIQKEVPNTLLESATIRFGDAIHFLGLHEPFSQNVSVGQPMVIETLWTVETQPTQDYNLVIRLTDATGQVWYQEQVQPFGGMHLTSHWLPPRFTRLPLFFEPADRLPPANYQLDLHLTSTDGQVLYPEGSTQPLPLGTLTVTRKKEPTEPQNKGPDKINGPLIGEALRVQPEPLPERLPPAPTLPLTLLIEAITDGPFADHFDIILQNKNTNNDPNQAQDKAVTTVRLSITDGLPTNADGTPQFLPNQWQAGDIFTLRYQIQLPPTLAGEYDVQLLAKQQDTPLSIRRWWGLQQAETLSLGSIFIEPRTPRTDVPPFEHDVTNHPAWQQHVRLLGYSAQPEPATKQEPLHLQLIWQAIAPTERPYKVFLHLINEEGTFITGADALFDVPALAWMKGELIISEHTFYLDQVPAGRYTLLVGLYHEASQERLPVDAPNFASPMGSIEVAE